MVNLDTANWTHEKGAAAGSEGAMLHADEASHGMDLLVRFPAGHIIAPHWHESNEAHEVQRLSCSSKTRCTFYLPWDGKPDSHPAQ